MKEKNENEWHERLVFLNTSILTNYGSYSYSQTDISKVKQLISEAIENNTEILSAIGHESTAQILTDLTGHNVLVNRIQYKQEFHDIAIVFKLNGRPPEGKILTVEEIEVIGYEFGLLYREN